MQQGEHVRNMNRTRTRHPTWTPWTDHFVTRSCLIRCTSLDRTCYSHVRHQVWVSRNAGNYSCSGFRKHLARRQGVRGSHSGDAFARFRISDDRSREPTHGRPRTMHFWEGILALSSEMNMILDTLSVIIAIGQSMSDMLSEILGYRGVPDIVSDIRPHFGHYVRKLVLSDCMSRTCCPNSGTISDTMSESYQAAYLGQAVRNRP